MRKKTLATRDGSHPSSEEMLLKLLCGMLPKPSKEVISGIGDDCAVVKFPSNNDFLQLLKTDAVVEGVHFTPETPLASVGWKALCRPISDIAATGGMPKHALITVAAPSSWRKNEWRSLYRGIGKASLSFDISVIGGETVRSPGPLFISVAIAGYARKENLRFRSGGHPGDLICVTGRLGGSFKSGRHLCFHPRLQEGQWLSRQSGVTAMMDLSDGLGSDLPKLSSASGCSFHIATEEIPLNRGCSVTDAVSDGEDYELIFTLHPTKRKSLFKKWRALFPRLPITYIGELTASSTASSPIASGYDHLKP